MRVVCPYVPGRLTFQTVLALNAGPGLADFCRLPIGDPLAYGRLFRRLWAGGRTFVLCEHDIAPSPSQLEQILTCGHEWCSYGYDDGMYPDGPMFGLARFDAAVMAKWPHAADIALVIGKRRDTEAEWWRVDSLVASDLKIRGVEWHRHDPPVRHLHHGPPSGPP